MSLIHTIYFLYKIFRAWSYETHHQLWVTWRTNTRFQRRCGGCAVISSKQKSQITNKENNKTRHAIEHCKPGIPCKWTHSCNYYNSSTSDKWCAKDTSMQVGVNAHVKTCSLVVNNEHRSQARLLGGMWVKSPMGSHDQCQQALRRSCADKIKDKTKYFVRRQKQQPFWRDARMAQQLHHLRVRTYTPQELGYLQWNIFNSLPQRRQLGTVAPTGEGHFTQPGEGALGLP